MSVKQPTLHDVARLAGVSHQTVSRVINSSPNVADDTRKRVQDSINALHYRPNQAARSLITGRSQTLQVIDFDAYYVTPLPPIISIASEKGYKISVSTVKLPDSVHEFRKLMDDSTARQVDGFLLFAMDLTVPKEILDQLCRGAPYVQLGSSPADGVPAVLFDQVGGMRQLMNHLFNMGHKRIAEISGPFTKVDARQRHAVVQDMLHDAGLEPGPWVESDFQILGGYEKALELLSIDRSFTALVCGNDQAAVGAMRAINEVGLRVPDDIAVVGFDDEHFAAYLNPPLTTVRQDFLEQARRGIGYILAKLEDPETPMIREVICPELVVRKSS
ncbi:MAG: LacI family DNA-binding transcriptional regulator [Anaerolineae bacterium]|nr:LacI family DNA-binding transcriptional regulator [Anaerolineae bacterium]